MKSRSLEYLTLSAVQAASIAHHASYGMRSHFNPDVSVVQRLATLGDQISNVFREAADVEREVSTDSVALQKNLIELAATALIWAELLDKHDCPRADLSKDASLEVNIHLAPKADPPCCQNLTGPHKESAQ